MEQLGLPPETMRRRVEETLDLLGIADLRARDLRTLSGGQQQRVAIGSVLTMHPRLLVLDEPTSALDPTAAEDVLATLTRLVHDLGVSVLLAEHRLERVVPFVDRMCLMAGDGTVRVGEPVDLLGHLPGGAADRRAGPGRRLAPAAAERPGRPPPRPRARRAARAARRARTTWRRTPPLEAQRVTVAHGPTRGAARRRPRAARAPGHRADGAQRLGQVVADVGAAGQRPPQLRRASGSARWTRPGSIRRAGAGWSAWCRRAAADLLYLETVAEECAAADGGTGACRPDPRPAGPRASPTTSTPATSPRGSGWRWPWPWCSPRGPTSCSSTSRRAGSTTPPSTCWPGSCATWPPTGTRCWSRPTTWSSWPWPPTTSSSSPTARWSPRGRYAAWSPSRRRSRRRCTKVLGAPWLRVDEVVAALDAS